MSKNNPTMTRRIPNIAVHTLLMPLLACGWMLTSCSQNEVMDYALDGRVYFNETITENYVTRIITEKNYSFALQNSSLMHDTMTVVVQLMGNVADHDRAFRAVAVADSTTAQSPLHYTILPGVMKAGEYTAPLQVVVNRTADTQDHYVSVLLQLVDTDDLHTGNADALTFRLNWGDILMPPPHWPYFFGTYSINKYRFAIDVLGLTDWPQATRFQDTEEEGVYSSAVLQLFAAQLNEAYAEYRRNNPPIYVDDNAEEKVEIYYSPES